VATTTITTWRRRRRSLLFSDITSSWGNMLKVNWELSLHARVPLFEMIWSEGRIISKRTTKSN
jgi:hypothetical protein